MGKSIDELDNKWIKLPKKPTNTLYSEEFNQLVNSFWRNTDTELRSINPVKQNWKVINNRSPLCDIDKRDKENSSTSRIHLDSMYDKKTFKTHNVLSAVKTNSKKTPLSIRTRSIQSEFNV